METHYSFDLVTIHAKNATVRTHKVEYLKSSVWALPSVDGRAEKKKKRCIYARLVPYDYLGSLQMEIQPEKRVSVPSNGGQNYESTKGLSY
jgi:hypothetical protein